MLNDRIKAEEVCDRKYYNVAFLLFDFDSALPTRNRSSIAASDRERALTNPGILKRNRLHDVSIPMW